jgi:integrase
MTVGMALSIYAEGHALTVAAPERIGYAIDALDRFWGDLPVSAVKGELCRRYGRERCVSDGTVRRELGTLRAALNYCHAEGYLTTVPAVVLPQRPPAKERWLTRSEAARLLRAARSLRKGRHLADFVLAGLYTGSRKASILALCIDMPSTTGGHVDTSTGVIYRRSAASRETAKRQTPARLPSKYLAHLKRQAARGRRYVVEDRGARVGDIRKAWSHACEIAGLHDVTPHTLRHTAITWALQGGATIWDCSGYFGASVETIQRTYGHHAPDHMETAVRAMDGRNRKGKR